MNFEDILSVIKNTVRISDVVSQKVRLQNKGTGKFLGLCPFHKEKTPSFNVLDNDGYYHCFGCGESGDIVKFIQVIENLNFPEAIKHLADKYGIPCNKTSEASNSKYNKVKDAILQVQHIFLESFKANSNAQKYLEGRNLSSTTIFDFGIGYSDEDVIAKASKLGIASQLLLDAGLAKKREDGSLYSFFRKRITIPIRNVRGEIVGFGARSIDSNEKIKYINTAETLLFKKKDVLYNFDKAIKCKKLDNQNLILVEGYMDVITMYQAGFKTAIAPMGTGLTESQISQILNVDLSPVICMDGDNAGWLASLRIAKLMLKLLKPGMLPRFVILRKAKDPDEVLNKFGISYFMDLIQNSISIDVFLWSVLSQKTDFNNPASVSLLLYEIDDLTSSITHKAVKSAYRSKFYDLYYDNKRNLKKFLICKCKELKTHMFYLIY